MNNFTEESASRGAALVGNTFHWAEYPGILNGSSGATWLTEPLWYRDW